MTPLEMAQAVTPIVADHAYKYMDDEDSAARLPGPEEGWHYTVAVRDDDIRIVATLDMLFPNALAAFEDAVQMFQEVAEAADGAPLGHETRIAVYSTAGTEDESDEGAVAHWYAFVSVRLRQAIEQD